jgi:hypothetical protein
MTRVLVALAMLADLITFAAVIETVGIGAELNPVMAAGYSQAGILAVAALKLAALAAIVLLVARVRTRRLRVLAAGIAIVVGLTGAASNVNAWASRPARVEPAHLPAGLILGRTGAPASLRAVPPVRITIATPVTGRGPVASRDPRTAVSLRGYATWFNSPAGVSAAGPDLRAALGPGWRGTHVLVCHDERCVVTVLGDTMAADRLVDLHRPLFARLAPLSTGVLAVTLTPIPAPPVTSTRETP